MSDISRNEAVAVGATAVEVAPARNRTVLYYKNISTAGQVITVWMSSTGAAAVNTGQVLNPQDWISDSSSQGYSCWSGAVTAISSAAGGVLTVFERVI